MMQEELAPGPTPEELASGPALLSDGDVLHISGDLNIYSAAQVWRLWRAQDPVNPLPARLNLAQVAELDTAGLQILLMLRRELASVDRTLTIATASPIVEQTLRMCGMSGLLAPELAQRSTS